MIRDTRKINIETNFFSDENDNYQQKLQQDTNQSTLQTKQKSFIALLNILDTIRLRRLITSFNLLISTYQHTLIKQSSKLIRLQQPYNKRQKPKNSSQSKQKVSRQKLFRNQYQGNTIQQKRQPKFINTKRSKTANTALIKQSHFLRESRKRILDGISKQLEQKPYRKSKPLPNQLINPTISHNPTHPPSQPHHSKQHLQINLRLQKLEHLIQNIRRQKQHQIPIIIHQKIPIYHQPKKQKNYQQMKLFFQEIFLLKKQVQEVKILNQSILRKSRQKSMAYSRIAKSQHFSKTSMKIDHFVNNNPNKKSQFHHHRYQKHGKSMSANKSQKVYKLKINQQQFPIKQQNHSQISTPQGWTKTQQQPKQIIRETTIQINTSEQNKLSEYTPPEKTPPEKSEQKTSGLETVENNLGDDTERYSPISKFTRLVSKQFSTSGKLRLKRQPSVTSSQDQLNNNQLTLTTETNRNTALTNNKNQLKQAIIKKIDYQSTPVSIEQPDQLPISNPPPITKTSPQNSSEKNELKLTMTKIDTKQQPKTTVLPLNQKPYKQKQWYKKYSQSKSNHNETRKKSTDNNRYQSYINARYKNKEDNTKKNVKYQSNTKIQRQKPLQNNYEKPSFLPIRPNEYINHDDNRNKINKNSANQDKYHDSHYVAAAYQPIYDNETYLHQSTDKKYNQNNDEITQPQTNPKIIYNQQPSDNQRSDQLKQIIFLPCHQSKSYQQTTTDNYPSSLTYNNISINSANLVPGTLHQQTRIQTCNTISDYDNGSCNSYTYSKGSSAFTNFNKLQQQSSAMVSHPDHNIQDNFDKIQQEDILQYQSQHPRNYYTVINAEHCQTSKAYKEKQSRNSQNMYQSKNTTSPNTGITQKQQYSWQKKLRANIHPTQLQKLSQPIKNSNEILSTLTQTNNQNKNLSSNFNKFN